MLIMPLTPAPQTRRVALLSVEGARLVDLLAAKHKISIRGIPDGARFEGMWYDPRTDTLKIVLGHESFAPVEAGCLFPEIHACVTIHYEGDAHG